MSVAAEDTVRALGAAWADDDHDQFLALWTDDGVWRDTPNGTFRGVGRIHNEFVSYRAKVGKVHWDITNILSADRTVLVERVDTFTLDGTTFSHGVFGAFDITGDGRITRWQDYYDLHHCLKQFEAAGMSVHAPAAADQATPDPALIDSGGTVLQNPEPDRATETVRAYCSSWAADPSTMESFFSDESVWIDGERAVVRGRRAIGAELVAQRQSSGRSWLKIVGLVSDGHLVLIERRDTVEIGGLNVPLDVAAAFEVDHNGLIARWRDYYDLNLFTEELVRAGISLEDRIETYEQIQQRVGSDPAGS